MVSPPCDEQCFGRKTIHFYLYTISAETRISKGTNRLGRPTFCDLFITCKQDPSSGEIKVKEKGPLAFSKPWMNSVTCNRSDWTPLTSPLTRHNGLDSLKERAGCFFSAFIFAQWAPCLPSFTDTSRSCCLFWVSFRIFQFIVHLSQSPWFAVVVDKLKRFNELRLPSYTCMAEKNILTIYLDKKSVVIP
jgi:hypothetical protein